jgi:IMP and pyridine-specific 5'-nucleotidase
MLPEMQSWTEDNVKALLDVAESALKDCVHTMQLPVSVLRKERAVGIYPSKGIKLAREQLEETVLVTQRILVSCLYSQNFTLKLLTIFQELSEAGKRIPFCAFNGKSSTTYPLSFSCTNFSLLISSIL